MTRLLSDESGPSGTHQRFIVQVKGSAQTLLIENNIDVGKRVPLVTGDAVVVHGEYIWNEQGGLIHFTHHDPDHSHEGGWIESKGVRYSSQATSDYRCDGPIAPAEGDRGAAVVRLACVTEGVEAFVLQVSPSASTV